MHKIKSHLFPSPPYRQRLWRWLDHRHRHGITALDSKSLHAVMTLAALEGTHTKLGVLARMVLYLQLYEIQSAHWAAGSASFLSRKVDPVSGEDFKGLVWMLGSAGGWVHN